MKRIIFYNLPLFALLIFLSTTCYGQTEQEAGEDWDILYNGSCFFYGLILGYDPFVIFTTESYDVQINFLIPGIELTSIGTPGTGVSSSSLHITKVGDSRFSTFGISDMDDLFLFPPPPSPRPRYPLTAFFDLWYRSRSGAILITHGVLNEDMIVAFNISIVFPFIASHGVCWGSK